MNSEQLFESVGNIDPELIARADKDVSQTRAYLERKNRQLTCYARYFFVTVACLLLFFVLVKYLN